MPQPPLQRLRANGKNTPKGLNENYGRELMELHTLGVDGGYTQQDVTEVARAFTGWTIENPRQGGGFRFDARLHDPGEKIVLGHVIKAGGGERDGEQVLDILAQPSGDGAFHRDQARPPVCQRHASARAGRQGGGAVPATDGDLREVMRTILTSPEFLAPGAYGTKIKTPLEFVVSAVRATGAQVDNAQPLVRAMRELGMPLYLCQPPTGYRDTADAWVNTGALVGRMNFALRPGLRPVAGHRRSRPGGDGAVSRRRRSAHGECRRDATTIAQATTRTATGGADARLAGISKRRVIERWVLQRT